MFVRTIIIGALAIALAPAQSVTGDTQIQGGGFINREIYHGYATAASAKGDIVIPQVVDGGPWKTGFRFVNLSSHPLTFNVLFFSDSGADMSLPISGVGTAINLTVTLPVANSIDIETAGTDATLTQGWAQVLLESTADSISGFTTFRERIAGMPDQEITVPMVSQFGDHFAVMFDNTKFSTGLAVANASSTDSIAIPVNIRDEQGNLIGSPSISLAPDGHAAFDLPSTWSSTVGRQGTIEFMASGLTIGAMGLRFDGTAFTGFPVLNNFSWTGESSKIHAP